MSEKKSHLELQGGEQYLKAAYDPEHKPKEKPHYVEYMDRAEAGLQTVKVIVYAGMTAFVILAASYYYLIYQLARDAEQMTVTMQDMSQTMQNMTASVVQINQSVQQMTDSVNRIQYSAGHMDRSFSTPMNAMNRFMPWGGERTLYPPSPLVYPPQQQGNGPQDVPGNNGNVQR